MKRGFIRFIFSLLICSFPVFNMVRWITMALKSSKSFPELKAEYLSIYPEFLQNPFLLTVINILLLVIGGVLFYQLQVSAKLGRASRICMIICILLIAWQIFSLM